MEGLKNKHVWLKNREELRKRRNKDKWRRRDKLKIRRRMRLKRKRRKMLFSRSNRKKKKIGRDKKWNYRSKGNQKNKKHRRKLLRNQKHSQNILLKKEHKKERNKRRKQIMRKFKIEEADRNSRCKWIQMKRKVHLQWKQRNSCKMVRKEVSHRDNNRMKQLEELDWERLDKNKEQRNLMNNNKLILSKELLVEQIEVPNRFQIKVKAIVQEDSQRMILNS